MCVIKPFVSQYTNDTIALKTAHKIKYIILTVLVASALSAYVCESVCFHCVFSPVIYCRREVDCVILQTSKWCLSDDNLPTLQITAQINTQ